MPSIIVPNDSNDMVTKMIKENPEGGFSTNKPTNFGVEKAYGTPLSFTGKYIEGNQLPQYGYNENYNQDLLAMNQSGFEKTYKGVARIGTVAAFEIAKMIPALVGMGIAGVGNLSDIDLGLRGDGSDVDNFDGMSWINNKAVQWLDEREQEVKDSGLAIYTSSGYDNMSWDEKLTKGDFWATQGADGLGFMVSMFAPGAVLRGLGLAGKVARTGARAGEFLEGVQLAREAEAVLAQGVKAGEILSTATKTERAAYAAAKLGVDQYEIGSAISKAAEASNTQKMLALASRWTKPAWQIGDDGLSTIGKQTDLWTVSGSNAIFESASEANETYNSFYAEIKRDNPDIDDDKAKEMAGNAAATTFKWNLPTLLLSNMLLESVILNKFDSHLGIGKRSAKEAVDDAADIMKKFDIEKPDMKFSQYLATNAKPITYGRMAKELLYKVPSGMLKEGVGEEGLQNSIQRYAKAAAKAGGDTSIFKDLGGIFDQYGKSLTDLGDNEFWESVALGAALGGFGEAGIGSFVKTAINGGTENIAYNRKMFGGQSTDKPGRFAAALGRTQQYAEDGIISTVEQIMRGGFGQFDVNTLFETNEDGSRKIVNGQPVMKEGGVNNALRNTIFQQLKIEDLNNSIKVLESQKQSGTDEVSVLLNSQINSQIEVAKSGIAALEDMVMYDSFKKLFDLGLFAENMTNSVVKELVDRQKAQIKKDNPLLEDQEIDIKMEDYKKQLKADMARYKEVHDKFKQYDKYDVFFTPEEKDKQLYQDWKQAQYKAITAHLFYAKHRQDNIDQIDKRVEAIERTKLGFQELEDTLVEVYNSIDDETASPEIKEALKEFKKEFQTIDSIDEKAQADAEKELLQEGKEEFKKFGATGINNEEGVPYTEDTYAQDYLKAAKIARETHDNWKSDKDGKKRKVTTRASSEYDKKVRDKAFMLKYQLLRILRAKPELFSKMPNLLKVQETLDKLNTLNEPNALYRLNKQLEELDKNKKELEKDLRTSGMNYAKAIVSSTTKERFLEYKKNRENLDKENNAENKELQKLFDLLKDSTYVSQHDLDSYARLDANNSRTEEQEKEYQRLKGKVLTDQGNLIGTPHYGMIDGKLYVYPRQNGLNAILLTVKDNFDLKEYLDVDERVKFRDLLKKDTLTDTEKVELANLNSKLPNRYIYLRTEEWKDKDTGELRWKTGATFVTDTGMSFEKAVVKTKWNDQYNDISVNSKAFFERFSSLQIQDKTTDTFQYFTKRNKYYQTLKKRLNRISVIEKYHDGVIEDIKKTEDMIDSIFEITNMLRQVEAGMKGLLPPVLIVDKEDIEKRRKEEKDNYKVKTKRSEDYTKEDAEAFMKETEERLKRGEITQQDRDDIKSLYQAYSEDIEELRKSIWPLELAAELVQATKVIDAKYDAMLSAENPLVSMEVLDLKAHLNQQIEDMERELDIIPLFKSKAAIDSLTKRSWKNKKKVTLAEVLLEEDLTEDEKKLVNDFIEKVKDVNYPLADALSTYKNTIGTEYNKKNKVYYILKDIRSSIIRLGTTNINEAGEKTTTLSREDVEKMLTATINLSLESIAGLETDVKNLVEILDTLKESSDLWRAEEYDIKQLYTEMNEQYKDAVEELGSLSITREFGSIPQYINQVRARIEEIDELIVKIENERDSLGIQEPFLKALREDLLRQYDLATDEFKPEIKKRGLEVKAKLDKLAALEKSNIIKKLERIKEDMLLYYLSNQLYRKLNRTFGSVKKMDEVRGQTMDETIVNSYNRSARIDNLLTFTTNDVAYGEKFMDNTKVWTDEFETIEYQGRMIKVAKLVDNGSQQAFQHFLGQAGVMQHDIVSFGVGYLLSSAILIEENNKFSVGKLDEVQQTHRGVFEAIANQMNEYVEKITKENSKEDSDILIENMREAVYGVPYDNRDGSFYMHDGSYAITAMMHSTKRFSISLPQSEAFLKFINSDPALFEKLEGVLIDAVMIYRAGKKTKPKAVKYLNRNIFLKLMADPEINKQVHNAVRAAYHNYITKLSNTPFQRLRITSFSQGFKLRAYEEDRSVFSRNFNSEDEIKDVFVIQQTGSGKDRKSTSNVYFGQEYYGLVASRRSDGSEELLQVRNVNQEEAETVAAMLFLRGRNNNSGWQEDGKDVFPTTPDGKEWSRGLINSIIRFGTTQGMEVKKMHNKSFWSKKKKETVTKNVARKYDIWMVRNSETKEIEIRWIDGAGNLFTINAKKAVEIVNGELVFDKDLINFLKTKHFNVSADANKGKKTLYMPYLNKAILKSRMEGVKTDSSDFEIVEVTDHVKLYTLGSEKTAPVVRTSTIPGKPTTVGRTVSWEVDKKEREFKFKKREKEKIFSIDKNPDFEQLNKTIAEVPDGNYQIEVNGILYNIEIKKGEIVSKKLKGLLAGLKEKYKAADPNSNTARLLKNLIEDDLVKLRQAIKDNNKATITAQRKKFIARFLTETFTIALKTGEFLELFDKIDLSTATKTDAQIRGLMKAAAAAFKSGKDEKKALELISDLRDTILDIKGMLEVGLDSFADFSSESGEATGSKGISESDLSLSPGLVQFARNVLESEIEGDIFKGLKKYTLFGKPEAKETKPEEKKPEVVKRKLSEIIPGLIIKDEANPKQAAQDSIKAIGDIMGTEEVFEEEGLDQYIRENVYNSEVNEDYLNELYNDESLDLVPQAFPLYLKYKNSEKEKPKPKPIIKPKEESNITSVKDFIKLALPDEKSAAMKVKAEKMVNSFIANGTWDEVKGKDKVNQDLIITKLNEIQNKEYQDMLKPGTSDNVRQLITLLGIKGKSKEEIEAVIDESNAC